MSSHKMYKHPIYKSWVYAKQRCLNEKNTNYKNYGERGIKICDRWKDSFENFRDDMFSTWQEGTQLDRIDVNGNYEPFNCKWSTPARNAKNKRNSQIIQSKYDGVSWHSKSKKWVIAVGSTFNSEEEAYFVVYKLKAYLKSLK